MRAVMKIRDNQDVLVQRAQKGDSSAFEKLVRECRPELEKYIQARIGDHLRSRVEPEDVLQETCTCAWESIGRIQWTGKDTFVRWMKGIARHVILQHVERRQQSELIYLNEERRTEEPSPSHALRREERFDRLQDAVNRLPPDYREAVLLVRIEGLQIKEAAERMKRTPKAVLHLLSRGLKKLQELLADTESLGLPPKRLEGGERDGT
jgi:RNA polymerase sigma factor (sigma-70 family)